MTHLIRQYDYATGRFEATWHGELVATASTLTQLARVTRGLERVLQMREADDEYKERVK